MSIRVIPQAVSTSAQITTSVPEVAPAAYAGGTTYASGARAGVTGTDAALTIAVYQSLQNGNTGHAPASSPTWWQYVGDTYQSYNVGSAYAVGNRVIDPANHLVYQCIVAGTGNPLTDTTKWFKVGPTNAWKMFYMYSNEPTVSPVPITLVITPGTRIDSALLRGIKATSAQITVKVGGTPIYSMTRNLSMRNTLSWSDYYFGKFLNKSSAAFFNIPLYSNVEITIVLTNTGGNVECAYCIVGRSEKLGDVRRGVNVDAINFSTVDRTPAGIATMTPARNVPKTLPEIYQDKAAINKMTLVRDTLNGAVAAWVGIDNDGDDYFETMLIVGFYRKFSINLRDNVGIVISLELEEI